MLEKLKSLIIIILIISLCYLMQNIYSLNKKIDNIESKKIVLKNTSEAKIDENISNKKLFRTKIFPNFESLDREFYNKLYSCTPAELATETELEYSIYGIQDDKCSFQKRQNSYILNCKLPSDVYKKYAEEGLEVIKQLEELKVNHKTGLVKAGDYINDINNNSGYCKSHNSK